MQSTEMDELIAVNNARQTVFKALLELSDVGRQKVLQSVIVELGLSLNSSAATPASNKGETVTRSPDSSYLGDFTTDRTQSPKAFMLEKSPRSDVERIVCLAYYLTHYRDLPFFKTVDISKLNTEAAQQKLSNASFAMNNATRTGYLVSAPKGQKQLSAAGELFVQALPDRDRAKEAMTLARPRKVTRKKSNSSGTKK